MQWYASKRYDTALKYIEEKIDTLKEKSVSSRKVKVVTCLRYYLCKWCNLYIKVESGCHVGL